MSRKTCANQTVFAWAVPGQQNTNRDNIACAYVLYFTLTPQYEQEIVERFVNTFADGEVG